MGLLKERERRKEERERIFLEKAMPLIVYWQLLNSEWVHRRIESIEFVDNCSVRRHVSVDFTVPEELSMGTHRIPLPAQLPQLPVTLLAKRALRDFSLVDDEGRSLPVLTTSANRKLATAALVAYATTVLGKEPHGDILDDLAKIVTSEVEDLVDARERMRSHVPGPTDGPPLNLGPGADGQRTVLMAQPYFRWLMETLSENFILLAHTPVRPGERRIVKFSYEHEVSEQAPGAWRWLRVRLGLQSAQFVLPTPAANKAESYHCEVDAPPGCEITDAVLDPCVAGHPAAREGGGIARAHLNVANLPLEANSEMSLSVRASRLGFLRPAALTCVLTTALLLAARTHLDQAAQQVEAADTVLLLVPGLLSAYLARPGEHALASSLLVGVRAMVVVAGLCAVAGSALLVGQLQPEDMEFWWTALTCLSAGASITVLAGNLLPSRGRP